MTAQTAPAPRRRLRGRDGDGMSTDARTVDDVAVWLDAPENTLAASDLDATVMVARSASRGARAVITTRMDGEPDEAETEVRDTLADLMHLTDALDLDWTDLIDRAARVWREECAEADAFASTPAQADPAP